MNGLIGMLLQTFLKTANLKMVIILHWPNSPIFKNLPSEKNLEM